MGRVRDYKTREDTMDWGVKALDVNSRRPIPHPDEVGWLTLEEYDNKVRLAHWYMRRAGMTPLTPGIVAPVVGHEPDVKPGRLFFVVAGLVAVTVIALTVIARVTAGG